MRILKKILYNLFYSLEKIITLFFVPNIKRKTIVIRTDAIGDYVLFRNFLKPLYEKYGKFTLVGNIAYQDFAMQLDGEYLEEFIPLNRKKFSCDLFYRFAFLKKLRKYSYQTLINPIYSRDRVSEDIARVIVAKEKIASSGDNSNLHPLLKIKYDKTYNVLLSAKKEVMFEFYRNLEFFRNLISPNLQVDFFIKLLHPQDVLKTFNLSLPYSILFIGASADFRKWDKRNFIEIGKFLHSQFRDNIVICGGKEDFENGEYIKSELEKSSITCFNLCGKTSLLELVKIIYNSNYLISNETSCTHIAMSIRHNKTFVISNGNHLDRFVPYPQNFVGYHPIFHPKIYDPSYATNNSGKSSLLNINEINFQSVIEKIQTLQDIKDIIIGCVFSKAICEYLLQLFHYHHSL